MDPNQDDKTQGGVQTPPADDSASQGWSPNPTPNTGEPLAEPGPTEPTAPAEPVGQTPAEEPVAETPSAEVSTEEPEQQPSGNPAPGAV